MWPLFIELIVSFCIKITQGKFMKLRENTGNFVLARMWPPCSYDTSVGKLVNCIVSG